MCVQEAFNPLEEIYSQVIYDLKDLLSQLALAGISDLHHF